MEKASYASPTRNRRKSTLVLSHPKPAIEKTPSGVEGLDEITFGGLPKGRPTLVYGGPGCGKTLFGIQFLARGARDYGEAGVFLSFDETIKDLETLARDWTWRVRPRCAVHAPRTCHRQHHRQSRRD